MKRYKVYTVEKGIVESDIYDEIRPLTWHKKDGPALIKYYDNGNIKYEEYWNNDKIHRLDGPAYIEYDIKGNTVYVAYWINDIEYTKEQYFNELLKLKVQSL